MGEKISVIVPVYNVEQYLERCVESIINQTYKNLEIILINDGSTDNSGKLCDELAKKDDRIKVIHKKNGGLSDARNRGIEEATAKVIGFIDSDDYIDKDMYEILFENLNKTGADLSMCGHYDVFNGVIPNQVENIEVKLLSPSQAINMVMEAKVMSVTAVNKLYKKDLEDAFIMIKLLDKCQTIVATNEKKYYYIHRENSITTQKFSLKFLNVIEAYEQNYKLIEQKYPELLSVAQMRMNWAYFYVLDKLLLDDNYKDIDLENNLINYLKKNKKNILSNTLFTVGRKLGFISLLFNRNIYKKIIEKRGY